jgi:hypothetical protein
MATNVVYQKPKTSPLLHKWLRKAHPFHSEYNGYLSNHLSHNLVVLGNVELSEEETESKMDWWYSLYVDRLEPLRTSSAKVQTAEQELDQHPTQQTITNSNWIFFVNNDNEHYGDFVAYFESELTRFCMGEEDVDDDIRVNQVLQKHLLKLMEGISGAALHPIIHLGFALESNNNLAMIAEGLAYLSTRNMKLYSHLEVIGSSSAEHVGGLSLLESTLMFLKEANKSNLCLIADQMIKKPPYSEFLAAWSLVAAIHT